MIRAGRNFFVFANMVFGIWFSIQAGATERSEDSPGQIASPIINGTIVTAGFRPWMAAIVTNAESNKPQIESHYCGGTLIDPLWIVTAAHCVDGEKPEDLKIIIGRDNLEALTGETRLVTEIVSYPRYANTFRGADIALLRLAQASTRTPLQIITPADEKSVEGQQVTVFGWGSTSGAGRPACELVFQDQKENSEGFECETYVYAPSDHQSSLMSAELTLASTLECNARFREILTEAGYPPVGLPTDQPPVPNELCAWDRTNSSSPCHGDSGGPLVATINGKQVLAGIIVRGVRPSCQTFNQLAFFTQVSSYANFIMETKGRSQELAFEAYCPSPTDPSVSYEPQNDGNKRVTISWKESTTASGYRLYYSALPRLGNAVGNLGLDAPTTEFSIILASGSKYMVALQAISENCDSPISEPLLVSVP